MPMIIRWLALFVAAMAVTACKTSSGDIGSGPVTLSVRAKLAFEQHKANDQNGYFALSRDGTKFASAWCPDLGNCLSEGRDLALRTCRESNNDQPCKIYANGNTIVWRGAEGEGREAKPTKAEIGSGPISLQAGAQRKLVKYFEYDEPLVFAVDKTGYYSVSLYCTNSPCTGFGYQESAVATCVERSRGLPCYVYAIGKKIVWRGAVVESRFELPGNDKIGSGPLAISHSVQKLIDRYFQRDELLVLAIAKSGFHYSSRFCTNPPCTGSGYTQAAIASCTERSGGSPCYIYAIGNNVVWKGPVTKLQAGKGSGPASAPADVSDNDAIVWCHLDQRVLIRLLRQECLEKGGRAG